MSEKEVMILNKLEYLKEIKLRMYEVDRIRYKLNEEMDLINVEERCLQEYRREMDSLYQEKMTHVEELRQIHSDINMLENVLKQSEEDRNRHVDTIKLLHHQMQPLKDMVDKMRSEVGLPRINDKEDDVFDKLELNEKRSFIKTDPTLDNRATTIDPLGTKTSSKPFNDNTNTSLQTNQSTSTFSPSLASLMSGFQEKHQPSAYSRLLMNSGVQGGGASFHQDSSTTSTTSPAAFRQQPPPMKSCLSCHQQIHRNAPICPLCKAKSRSRHPKRRNNQKN